MSWIFQNEKKNLLNWQNYNCPLIPLPNIIWISICVWFYCSREKWINSRKSWLLLIYDHIWLHLLFVRFKMHFIEQECILKVKKMKLTKLKQIELTFYTYFTLCLVFYIQKIHFTPILISLIFVLIIFKIKDKIN